MVTSSGFFLLFVILSLFLWLSLAPASFCLDSSPSSSSASSPSACSRDVAPSPPQIVSKCGHNSFEYTMSECDMIDLFPSFGNWTSSLRWFNSLAKRFHFNCPTRVAGLMTLVELVRSERSRHKVLLTSDILGLPASSLRQVCKIDPFIQQFALNQYVSRCPQVLNSGGSKTSSNLPSLVSKDPCDCISDSNLLFLFQYDAFLWVPAFHVFNGSVVLPSDKSFKSSSSWVSSPVMSVSNENFGPCQLAARKSLNLLDSLNLLERISVSFQDHLNNLAESVATLCQCSGSMIDNFKVTYSLYHLLNRARGFHLQGERIADDPASDLVATVLGRDHQRNDEPSPASSETKVLDEYALELEKMFGTSLTESIVSSNPDSSSRLHARSLESVTPKKKNVRKSTRTRKLHSSSSSKSRVSSSSGKKSSTVAHHGPSKTSHHVSSHEQHRPVHHDAHESVTHTTSPKSSLESHSAHESSSTPTKQSENAHDKEHDSHGAPHESHDSNDAPHESHDAHDAHDSHDSHGSNNDHPSVSVKGHSSQMLIHSSSRKISAAAHRPVHPLASSSSRSSTHRISGKSAHESSVHKVSASSPVLHESHDAVSADNDDVSSEIQKPAKVSEILARIKHLEQFITREEKEINQIRTEVSVDDQPEPEREPIPFDPAAIHVEPFSGNAVQVTWPLSLEVAPHGGKLSSMETFQSWIRRFVWVETHDFWALILTGLVCLVLMLLIGTCVVRWIFRLLGVFFNENEDDIDAENDYKNSNDNSPGYGRNQRMGYVTNNLINKNGFVGFPDDDQQFVFPAWPSRRIPTSSFHHQSIASHVNASKKSFPSSLSFVGSDSSFTSSPPKRKQQQEQHDQRQRSTSTHHSDQSAPAPTLPKKSVAAPVRPVARHHHHHHPPPTTPSGNEISGTGFSSAPSSSSSNDNVEKKLVFAIDDDDDDMYEEITGGNDAVNGYSAGNTGGVDDDDLSFSDFVDSRTAPTFTSPASTSSSISSSGTATSPLSSSTPSSPSSPSSSNATSVLHPIIIGLPSSSSFPSNGCSLIRPDLVAARVVPSTSSYSTSTSVHSQVDPKPSTSNSNSTLSMLSSSPNPSSSTFSNNGSPSTPLTTSPSSASGESGTPLFSESALNSQFNYPKEKAFLQSIAWMLKSSVASASSPTSPTPKPSLRSDSFSPPHSPTKPVGKWD